MASKFVRKNNVKLGTKMAEKFGGKTLKLVQKWQQNLGKNKSKIGGENGSIIWQEKGSKIRPENSSKIWRENESKI